MDETVTILLEDYQDLVVRDQMLAYIMATLYKGARLDYSKRRLAFDDNAIDIMLRAMDSYKYDRIIADLIDEDEEKGNE